VRRPSQRANANEGLTHQSRTNSGRQAVVNRTDPDTGPEDPREGDALEPLSILLREFAEWDARPIQYGYLDPL
jgi:hypothetical protein